MPEPSTKNERSNFWKLATDREIADFIGEFGRQQIPLDLPKREERIRAALAGLRRELH